MDVYGLDPQDFFQKFGNTAGHRSLVGAVACMPKACECRFHVTLTDDHHRVELKQMMETLEQRK